MADDKPEDAGLAPEPGRAKRAPPTIDLEATEISNQPQETAAEPEAQPAPEHAEPEQAKSDQIDPEPERIEAQASASSISPWVIAPFSGAVAAAVVIAVGWMLGWPAVQAPPAAPQVTAATVDALSGRVAAVEAKAAKPAADPATAARIDALEKSANSLRSDVANLRTQLDKTASALNDAKSPAAAPDLAALNDRIAQLERASKTERAELAQQGEKIADNKAMDDKPLRHVVAAALLDVAVRHGDPYEPQLAAARLMTAEPDMLKPLDAFASSGIPTPVALSRELLNIVPKLSPPAEAQPSDTGIVERLKAGASKLVRIERTGGVGNDRGAIVARVTAAALRNDFVEARRELKTLPEADRAPAQAWLDKTDARDAALAASRKFADDAMADLVKPAQ
ncbi:hypothetical protein JJB98_02240 [Bradyrhizobium diazoefficiens]|nr:hypothetical protein [Bradyrhizobium diazoefficiens]QQO18819.1 hypothetical protein JJB98_02240 [Bradyrhizobium diazoefficiens]